ncbi:MAG: polysaccharide deacetylase family protein [Bacteroidales bacterium]|nr:polysaccharide deacetylase family protein [Bacteroidales bacterium]
MKGSLIISLDFELLWGVIEKPYVRAYAESNVRNVPEVVDRMLCLFEKYGVKATFSTVGLLMCRDKEEAIQYSPTKKPSYNNQKLSPYGDYLKGLSKEDYSLYFAPMLVEKLRKCKNVEIGTHTYCHYYCYEEGQTLEEFAQDLLAANNIAAIYGIKLQSIVFPRNNVKSEYLEICCENGIICYRGNATKFFGKPKNTIHRLKNKLGRLLDSYIPLTTSNSYDYSSLILKKGCPINIPASRFFRPYNKRLALLETLRINRIKKEIINAAKKGRMYHLWWHPHNFGDNIELNLKNLELVLKCYADCHAKYGMQSYTMSELAEMIISKK